MNILITGHRGFVGRNLIRHLSKDPNNIITGVDLKEGNDCRDFFRADSTKFDLVFHLAAIVGGRAKIDGDKLSVASNLATDSEMFNWALRTNPTKVIYYSSSAAYPTYLQNKEVPIKLKENVITIDKALSVNSPDSTYGLGKVIGEHQAAIAREQYGLDVYVFRPFSGYGTDQDLDYPFPMHIDNTKNDRRFVIWGEDQARDWIHIDDVILATLEIIQQPNPGPVNLCTGIPTFFTELCEKMNKISGKDLAISFDKTKPMGVTYRVGDATKMLSMYKPKISIEEGIDRALYGV
jgi:nucleoside-diphosphate-sugar epimerase